MNELVIICKPPTGTNALGRLIVTYDCSLSGGSSNATLEDQTLLLLSEFGGVDEINVAIITDAASKIGASSEDRATLFGGVVCQDFIPK